MMKTGQTLISALQLSVQPKDFLKYLMVKKINAIAFDWIRDESDIFPVIRSMSEIVGGTSISIAEEYLSNVHDGPGSYYGWRFGYSTYGSSYTRRRNCWRVCGTCCFRPGAIVKVFDNSIYRLRRLQAMIGASIFTSTIRPRDLGPPLKNCRCGYWRHSFRTGQTPWW